MQTLKVKGRGEVPVSEVPIDTLKWYAEKCRNRTKQEIAQSELARRSGGSTGRAPQPSAPVAAIQRSTSNSSLVGSFIDPVKATRALAEAAKNYHLVTPATACGSIPEGCEVVLSMVQIDPNDPHLYGVGGGKFCPDKAHLISILNAIGGSMEFSRRLDDRSHPHYCDAEVGVVYRSFDGALIRRSGRAEMDAREPDGPRYVEILEQAKKNNRDPESQLLQLRKFLWRHTESRALLAAIGNIGVRRSYTRDELAKPFVVAGLMFTGRSEDPEARREFRQAIATSFLGGTQALYGAPQLSHTSGAHQLSAPPPVGSVGASDYDYESDGDDVPPSEPPAPPQQAAPPQQPPQQQTPQAAPAQGQQQLVGDGYDGRDLENL